MKKEEIGSKKITTEEFLDEVLPNRIGMSIGFDIESIDNYGMTISLQQSRVFCDDDKTGFGVKYGLSEIYFYSDMIESIIKYDDGSYDIELTANIPDIELKPSVIF